MKLTITIEKGEEEDFLKLLEKNYPNIRSKLVIEKKKPAKKRIKYF